MYYNSRMVYNTFSTKFFQIENEIDVYDFLLNNIVIELSEIQNDNKHLTDLSFLVQGKQSSS